MTKYMILKRVAALLLAMAVLLTTMPLLGVPLMTDAEDTRVADPSTMNDWQQHFGKSVLSTQNAGGVWTDKSVFTSADVFDGTGITMSDTENESFLVALSAIASNSAIKGLSNVPTDTMLVLDLSSSMYLDSVKDPATVQTMLEAVNCTIARLQSINAYNRVGVVLYFGRGDYLPSTANHAKVLLPLDRYTHADDVYLKTTVSGGKLISVDVNSGVADSRNNAVSGSHSPTDVAGDYLQLGILNALDELLAADPKIPASAEYLAGQTRLPIMVMMSDSEPTAATANYTAKETADMGNNTESFRNAAQTDFVTQLTASYAKEMLDEHYKDTTPLFFTLSLGSKISLDVMDPENNDARSLKVIADPDAYTAEENTAAIRNRAIDAYWNLLMEDGAVDITVQNCVGQWDATKVDATYTVSPATVMIDGNEVAFPQSKADKYYVDQAFTATDAAGLVEAFESIVSTIDLRSHYFPTLVEDNEEVSGYISFRDTIGEHMSITDIKGILINNVLFSGAMLSKNFVTGGGDLGTYDNPTSLGDELVWAVQARLGVDVNTARDLLGLSYSHKQLSYDTQTGAFSNYIGWYANSAEEYLGFWHEGIETMPDPNDPALTEAERPLYVIRSYGFLGAVDEEHGVKQTDMMYAIVQIRENLLTGEEMMIFEIPAALIPTVTYNITLDENGNPEDLNVTGADHPVRLVYEVALDEEIDEITVNELIEEGYAHKNGDGTYDFYTNAFDIDGNVGYATSNTRTAFVPSKQNERYYYTEDSMVYVDTNGTPYTGDTIDPNGVFYRGYTVYNKNGAVSARTVYERISEASLTGDSVEKREDGYWYILAGTVHTMLEGFVVDKTDNPTESLVWSNVPYVDTQYTYYTGATLGNNGRLTLSPQTGLKLTKTVDGADTKERFLFTVTSDDETENTVYDAVLKQPSGTKTATTVAFTDGMATVELSDGQSLYILGMTAGATYTVAEQPLADYKPVSINGMENIDEIVLTTAEHTFAHADFVNTAKGFGDVVLVKRVTHNLGSYYEMPEMFFEMRVNIGAEYAGETIEASYTGDSGIASVTADANGEFTVYLKNSEQFALKGLKEGTVVTATEVNIPDGFVPTYYGEGALGQNYVVVQENASISLIISNKYTSEELTDVNITIGGTKFLAGRENDAWLDADVYAFELQEYDGTAWETIATAAVDKDNKSFNFTDAMKAEVFTAPGNYSYQVIETLGSVAGVTYDRHIHTFTVVIGDPQMNGKLEVIDVIAYEGADHITGNNTDGWVITTDFTNTYSTEGKAVATVDVNKKLVNLSGSDLVNRSGFRFGLFEDGAETPAFVSTASDMVGEARVVAEFDTVGVYEYTLKEIVPEKTMPGMVYSTETYTVEITVSDDDDGTISAAVAISQDGKSVEGTPTFTNRYEPDVAELVVPVRKKIVGRDLNDNEFRFEIRSGDAVLATGRNRADGTVVFDQALSFSTVGDRYFDIVEVAGDVPGVTYDSFVYRIYVTVTDGGMGGLQVQYHVINVVTEDIVFTNYYKAASTQLYIEGKKNLLGRGLINDEFAFVLAEEGSFGLIMTTRNFTDGTFRFGPLTYTTEGTFRYTLSEVQSTTTHGIVFDPAQYDVVVTVNDIGDGVLHADCEITREGEEVEVPTFTNRYEPTSVQIALVGEKTLEGRVLGEGDFTFELYEADSRWKAVNFVDSAENDAEGNFSFDPLAITQGGTYRYVVMEQNSGQTIDGVTYDDEVYHVLLIATDDNRGTLRVSKTIFDSDNNYVEMLMFVNTYTTTTTESSTTTTTTGVTPPTTTATSPTATSTTGSTIPTTTTSAVSVSPQTGESRDMTVALVLFFVGGVCSLSLPLLRKKKVYQN